MNVLVINGTPRKHGRTRILASHLAHTHNTNYIDLSDFSLPLYNGEKDQQDMQEVKQLKEMALEAEGFILCTPEYHSGMSGALKNMLDFLGGDHFKNKPVALIAVAGGGKGGINALNNMRTVVRGLYGNAIPRQLVLDPVHFDSEQRMLTSDGKELVENVFSEFNVYLETAKRLSFK
ncbi:NADPH-dependent FMN reductase [Alkalihalobacterium chitinilyticum]|uniref:NAD(P)H-dependent oxidoreductase n=1 Tax=Alkalihalobacterium chitinilyticum TaxID=2980103 RepID=A0ABT5VH59_9BACI|nr:NADPH-dependent FMN reductase [Alkalihalobacterium chitinilyticum]MDE5414615.1 NAD(P)H-dependent oxidoreductase [Alkalihalobacterium chitinilyticum]